MEDSIKEALKIQRRKARECYYRNRESRLEQKRLYYLKNAEKLRLKRKLHYRKKKLQR